MENERSDRLPSLTVVLPAYNEEALIASTLDRVEEYLRGIEDRYSWEILAINDGSRDRTGEILNEYAAANERIRVLHHHTNFNLGQALRYAFSNARGDYTIVLDSDLSYGPEHIGRLADAITETRAKVAIASPYIKGGKVTAVPWFREKLSRWANKLLSMSAKGSISTLTGMVRAYDTVFLRKLNLKAWDFEINTEIIYKAQVLRALIVEIPAHLDWSDQLEVPERGSSIRIMRGILGQSFSSFLFRPFFYFIVPGLIVAVAALYSLGWSAYHTVNELLNVPLGAEASFSAAVARAYAFSPHSFLVGGIALLVAIQLVSLGIISAQQKRYFEEIFHLGTSILSRTNDPAR
ncbi:MAG: glycosyltransferase family 2 protein [bacterium]|nr:glycosyltransferase family 2 protein [bacterium]